MKFTTAIKTCTALGLLAFTILHASPSTRAADEAGGEAAFTGRWFSPDSPWNKLIPPNAETLKGSDGFLSAFLAGGHGININTETWTPAVFYAKAHLPRCTVSESGWLLEGLPLHPDFSSALEFFAGKGDTDASFCIYSEAQSAFYNLFNARAQMVDGKRRLLVGAVGLFSLRGSGWWDNTLGPWTGRASGASYCGGVVRIAEYSNGEIDHALSMAWPTRLVRASTMPEAFVFPARTTDGRGRNAKSAVPMGARLQLDPALMEDELLKLGVATPDLPIARALQRYGSYVVDSSDSVMAIYVESDRGREAPTARSRGTLPTELLKHSRFVKGPNVSPLESRLTAGQPVFVGKTAAQRDDCLLPSP